MMATQPVPRMHDDQGRIIYGNYYDDGMFGAANWHLVWQGADRYGRDEGVQCATDRPIGWLENVSQGFTRLGYSISD